MTERVVVGVSGEAADEGAVNWALEYARPRRFDVEFVHVVDEWRGMLPRSVRGEALLEAERQLRGEAERARSRVPGLAVHPTVTIGSTVDELVKRSGSAAALALGTHRAERLGRTVYSTRAARIAAHASCAVVVVPSDRASTGRGIVVGIDDSPASGAAVAFAAQEADRHREPLTVVYAWRIPPPAWTAELERFDWPTEPQEADHLVMGEAVAGLAERYPALVVLRDLNDRPPIDALITVARDARMLVVGSHGRSELTRLVLGSVSHDLLLVMPCPIAVVPPNARGAA